MLETTANEGSTLGSTHGHPSIIRSFARLFAHKKAVMCFGIVTLRVNSHPHYHRMVHSKTDVTSVGIKHTASASLQKCPIMHMGTSSWSYLIAKGSYHKWHTQNTKRWHLLWQVRKGIISIMDKITNDEQQMLRKAAKT